MRKLAHFGRTEDFFPKNEYFCFRIIRKSNYSELFGSIRNTSEVYVSLAETGRLVAPMSSRAWCGWVGFVRHTSEAIGTARDASSLRVCARGAHWARRSARCGAQGRSCCWSGCRHRRGLGLPLGRGGPSATRHPKARSSQHSCWSFCTAAAIFRLDCLEFAVFVSWVAH